MRSSRRTPFSATAVPQVYICKGGVLWASICYLNTHRCTFASVVCVHLFKMRSGTCDTLSYTCSRPSPQWHMIFGRKTGVALPCRRLEFTSLQTAWVVQSGPWSFVTSVSSPEPHIAQCGCSARCPVGLPRKEKCHLLLCISPPHTPKVRRHRGPSIVEGGDIEKGQRPPSKAESPSRHCTVFPRRYRATAHDGHSAAFTAAREQSRLCQRLVQLLR